MSQNEDSHDPEHFTSTKVIEAPVESTPSGGDHRTSTSTTTCETSEQTSTTEPPFHHSEVDATIDCNESMRIELLKISYEFLPIWAFATALLLSGLTYFTFLKLIPLDIAAPLFVGLLLIIISTMQFRRNMKS